MRSAGGCTSGNSRGYSRNPVGFPMNISLSLDQGPFGSPTLHRDSESTPRSRSFAANRSARSVPVNHQWPHSSHNAAMASLLPDPATVRDPAMNRNEADTDRAAAVQAVSSSTSRTQWFVFIPCLDQSLPPASVRPIVGHDVPLPRHVGVLVPHVLRQ